jgi:glycogen(starch) synthase
MPKKLDVHVPWARFLFADETPFTIHAFNSPLRAYMTSGSYYREDGAPVVYGANLFAEVLRYGAFGGEIAKREQFDIIYAHDWLSFLAGMEAKRATGKPLIVHVHATEFDRSGGGSVNQDVYNIEREGMMEADRVIAVSEFTKRLIVDRYGIDPNKVRVVYNGIDETTSPQISGDLRRLRALRKSGKKIVLFLGRITLQKGPDYFIRAAKAVLDRDKDVIFVVSGSGDMEAQMMRMAADMGLADKVFFTGFLQGADRDEMYAAADLFVMPSVSEPLASRPLRQ